MSFRTNRRTRNRFRVSGPEYHINRDLTRPEKSSLAFYDPEVDTIFFNKRARIRGMNTARLIEEDTTTHEYLHRLLAKEGIPVHQHHKIIFRMLYGAEV